MLEVTTDPTLDSTFPDKESSAPVAHEAQTPVVGAILAALIYADLFDYPLTVDEITRYGAGQRLVYAEVMEALATSPVLRQLTDVTGGYYHLAGRSELASTRTERGERSRRLWRRATRYGRWTSLMPFVRMVAVTGALSVHNIGAVEDIDIMVVAKPGRVWICRRALILCVRVARLLGDDLCPNYILGDANLELDQRDFYTAHELAQMVPLSGAGTYKRVLRANSWAAAYLPNAFGKLDMGDDEARKPRAQRLLEWALSHRALDRWERWELRRLRAKLRPHIGEAAEVVCSPFQCKGHTGLHRQSVLARFRDRAIELGVLHHLPIAVRDDLNGEPKHA